MWFLIPPATSYDSRDSFSCFSKLLSVFMALVLRDKDQWVRNQGSSLTSAMTPSHESRQSEELRWDRVARPVPSVPSHHRFPATSPSSLGFLGRSDQRQTQAQGSSPSKGPIRAAPALPQPSQAPHKPCTQFSPTPRPCQTLDPQNCSHDSELKKFSWLTWTSGSHGEPLGCLFCPIAITIRERAV